MHSVFRYALDLSRRRIQSFLTASACFAELCKHFALFLARTVEGRRVVDTSGDPAGVPQIGTITMYMWTFISLWKRFHALPVPAHDRTELKSYLKSDKFRRLAFTTTLKVAKHDLSLEDIQTLITILHANPHIVRTKHALLNAHLVILLIRFLGGRVGEYVESSSHFGSGHAPRYGKEVRFFAVPSVKDTMSEPLLAMQLVAPWLKNHREDESVRKVLVLVADRTFDPNFDPVAGSYARAFDDDVFTHFKSVDQLKRTLIDKWTELTVKPEWEGMFFLRAEVYQASEVVTSPDTPYRYGHFLHPHLARAQSPGRLRVYVSPLWSMFQY